MSAYRTNATPSSPGDWLWMEILQRGPMVLTEQEWKDVERLLPEPGRVAFRHLVDSLKRQTAWIVERTAAMRDEAERMALLGETMRRAGLRSYTDEKGRIFVAADPSGGVSDGR